MRPIRPPAARPIEFTISAINGRWRCCATSKCSNDAWDRQAQKNLLPMQPGDLPDTWADVEALARDVGYRPSTDLETGVKQFVEWYLEYYHPQS